MRIRIPELLKQRGLTPYGMAKASGWAISLSTAYRLTRLHGRVATLDSALLENLCDVLQVTPGELLERQPNKAKARRHKPSAARSARLRGRMKEWE